ncbi:dihydrodipicolinate synthase family protein [Jiangella anatolica]|uniref:5-dehydro-4-deoxyglucarate dehydratase n=1 Tax=Jiangella anatolica TaxID=2670374 RepID=A0A2W2CVH5_9ACTN|nr:dihydrodipicolinate synthase family protein [Jiangella anatolica]PZF84233.1 5-dehydro-4-deoxyglucarate dehydratase [Jiangella anatolica]
MELQTLRASLHGVLAFAPTSMHDDGSLDLDSQRAHVAFLAGSGAGAVVVAGGVGEFYALEEAEYAALVRETVDAVAGRVPVLAGVGHSTAIATRLARAAADAGADGLMVNPLYFVNPDGDGMVRHYGEIGAASGLGMIVFSTDGAVYDEKDLERLAEVEGAVAVKDEAGDQDLFARCVDRLGDRYVWINGMAELPAVDYARMGAVAMTSGLVNLDPAVALDVWAAALAGDADRHAAIVAERIAPIAALRASRPGYHITVIKEAMHLLGRGGPAVRLPLVPLRAEDRAALAGHLDRGGYRRAEPAL